MKEYCEKIALDAWLELSSSNLVTAEKLSKVPEIRFTNLGDKFLGRAYSDHIELNEKFLLEHQGKFADKCDLSTIPSDDWWRILLKQPQLAELCPAWDFRLDDWADLLKAQPHFFKRCGNICYLLLEYPDLYENWKLQDWAKHKIVAQSCTPLPPENHTLAEWYDIIMHDYRKCVLCDCLLELVLQYPEIFVQWCKFGTGSLYQPVFWQLTKA